jgi:hypothetical protein
VLDVLVRLDLDGRAAEEQLVRWAAFFNARDEHDVEDRVTRCTDLAQLDEWLRRAVIVASAEEIFG